MADRFSISSRIQSFKFALRGIGITATTQHNAWLHATATLAVVALGLFLHLSVDEWRWIVCAIGLVWAAEASNTALERLADAAVPDLHPLVRDAKDAAAGAVLIASATAVIIGLLVLGPPLLEWIASLG